MTDIATALLTGGLWVFALARVTRFIVADRLTDFVRNWAWTRSQGRETYLTYFLECPWCVSVWLAFGTAWVIWLPGGGWPWWIYPLAALTASYMVGLMAENLEEHDDVEIEEEQTP